MSNGVSAGQDVQRLPPMREPLHDPSPTGATRHTANEIEARNSRLYDQRERLRGLAARVLGPEHLPEIHEYHAEVAKSPHPERVLSDLEECQRVLRHQGELLNDIDAVISTLEQL